jgi:redox-sensitive bicupin YhaK (pirin superfamily)
MKIYRLPQLIEGSPDSQYRLDFEDLQTHAVYLLYGRLRPGETGRRLCPPEGHEEIICVVKGHLMVKRGSYKSLVGEGEAFHLNSDDTLVVDNPKDAETIYIAAGGRTLEKQHIDDPEKIQQKAANKAPQENHPPEEKPQKETPERNTQEKSLEPLVGEKP